MFGPSSPGAGTGKTWHTLRRAVEICDGRLPGSDAAAVHRRFNELREARRIELVTFHQSYGYEEFVEGIRPVLTGDLGNGDATASPGVGDVRYECRDGVFKRVCSLARGSGTTARRGMTVDLSRARSSGSASA